MCRYNSLVTRVTSLCPHVGMEIYMTATTVDGHSLLPIGLLLVGHSGHRCGCSVKYTCASCWQALLATSQAAPCWVLQSLVRLLRKLGCAHATTSLGAATKRRVAKDMALHVQYLLKSILCNSRKQIQQLRNPGSSNPFPFIPEPLPRVSSQLSNHQGGHQGHRTLDDHGTQGARIILDPFLEHPEFGLLLAGCQRLQSDFRTGHFPPQLKLSSHAS